MRYIHANALVIDGQGILIRGVSKSGKSTLTLALLEEAEACGKAGRLIGDDRIGIAGENGELIARGHPAIAGLIEVRGSGIHPIAHEAQAAIRLVVDLGTEQGEGSISLEGVKLRHLCLSAQQDLRKMLHCVMEVLK